ncbi:MAG: hypothetical protein B7W98_03465, partial [Parcubacteria group bacterium 20-58-5]
LKYVVENTRPGIKRVVVATYQASSGKGAKGLFELDAQLAREVEHVQALLAHLDGDLLAAAAPVPLVGSALLMAQQYLNKH